MSEELSRSSEHKDETDGGPEATDGARFPIVGVGASAGGLEAFTELLNHLPLDTGMAFVLVQHLDPLHESALTQLLARATAMPVQEITDTLRVERNHVYIIPPNTHLTISGSVLKLLPRDKSRTPHRSVDNFFESLAADQRECAVGVILSGTATDGTLGLEAIKSEGGITFAQDDSARYDSMPRSAAAAGCVDFVLAPKEIAAELARLAQHPYVAGASIGQTRGEADHTYATTHQSDATALPSGGSGEPDVGAQRSRAEADGSPGETGSAGELGFQRVVALLRAHCGVDFSLYKSSTIQRRIARRMLLCRQETLADYAHFIKGNAQELDALFSDVLISVTSFFRNPEAFEVLHREILPKLLAQGGDDPLRVWVLGCSTGQEAYSVAMSFVEAAEQSPSRGRKLQVFATDLNDALLEKARQGLYAKTLAADLSPERLRRFFTEESGGYRISKPLREMVIFARQNLINDPPFSRIDIITCRNLLIYLEPDLQKKLFPLFHYALKPHGFLWLGASESVGGFTDLFEPLDRKHKIYTKKSASTPPFTLPAGVQRLRRDTGSAARPYPSAGGDLASAALVGLHADQNAQREADRVTVSQYAPPGVIINADRQIVQFRGVTSPFLEPPTGAASFDLLKMARDGLMLPLRSAIAEAEKEMKAVRREGLNLRRDGDVRKINFEVVPLKNLREPNFLILFEEHGRVSGPASAQKASQTLAALPALEAGSPHADKLRIAELERDLSETRDYVRALQENHEAATEELQAANEEVQSANEELQSLNEELTTSKEELESSNEELSTLNQEMNTRNAELSVLGNDMLNLQMATNLVTVLLGRDLTVRRFSTQAEKQFRLLAADIGRHLGNLRLRLAIDDLDVLIEDVIGTMQGKEREVQDNDGHWYLLRVRPYVTMEKKIDGAVLMLLDIDHLKRNERALFETDAQYRAIFDVTSVGVCEAEPLTGRLLRVNQQFTRMLGLPRNEVLGRTLAEMTHAEDRRAYRDGMARLIEGEAGSYTNDLRLLRKDGSELWVQVTINLVRSQSNEPVRTVAIVLDISQRKVAQEAALESERRFREMIDALPTAVYTTDADGLLTHFNPATLGLAGRRPQIGVDRWCVMARVFRADGTVLPHEQSSMAAMLASGRAADTEQVIGERADGSRIWFKPYPAPLHDAQGRMVGGINMLVDTSANKQAESRLVESDQHKTAFLAMLAHELRNPLAPIRSALQILERAVAAQPQAAEGAAPASSNGLDHSKIGGIVGPTVQMMNRQVTHMVRLVDDLLDVSRISQGKIELRRERISLGAVMHQIEQSARLQCESMDHELTFELPEASVVLNADPARLVQIIGNLINNACKFTERGGQIAVTAEVTSDLSNADFNEASLMPQADADADVEGARRSRARVPLVVIRVRDNGIGIAPKELPNIFQMFMQVDSSLGRSAGGLGIGLALVKDLVVLHGGTVAVRSEGLGHGSEFEVRLPIEQVATPLPVVAVDVKVAASAPRRFLVVDDNRDAAETIAALLRSEGHETHLAHDGLAAVEAAAQWRPDVVLLDIGLPGIDGYEAARRIRAQESKRAMMLVALTGWGQAADRARTAEAGFDLHMVKPVEFDELMNALR